MLAAQCLKELDSYRRGEPYIDGFSVELLRRATMQDDQETRVWVHYCFGRVVLDWLSRHPKKAHA
jgi:hypothetical protein